MNNKPILKTLEHIVSDNESFDSDIVDLIFKKIEPKISEIHYNYHHHHDDFLISGNLWATLCFNSLLMHGNENINTWKAIIEKYSPNSTANNKSIVNNSKIDEFSKNFFPVEVSPECIRLAFKGEVAFSSTDIKKFTENENILILIKNFQTQYDSNHESINNNPLYCDYLLNSLIKNRKKMTEIFNLEEGVFINKILESKPFKQLIANIEPVKLLDLISETDLRAIIKKSVLQENVKNTPNMLNNLLPLATPDKWLNAYKNKKSNFNILSFFDSKYFLTTGKNIAQKKVNSEKRITNNFNVDKRGTRKETHTGHYNIREQMTEEFKYLMPALKAEKIENNTVIQWYRALIRADLIDLFKLSAIVIPIPSKKSENIDLIEYESLQKDLKNSNYDSKLQKNTFYYQAYEEVLTQKLAEKIQKELPETNKTTKIKI